jgi:hypothetical protein
MLEKLYKNDFMSHLENKVEPRSRFSTWTFIHPVTELEAFRTRMVLVIEKYLASKLWCSPLIYIKVSFELRRQAWLAGRGGRVVAAPLVASKNIDGK